MKTINNEKIKELLISTMVDEFGIGCDLFYTSSSFYNLMSKNIGEINDSPEDILKNIFENIEETVLYYQKKLNEKNEEINKIKLYKEFVESNKTLNTEYSNWVEIKKNGEKIKEENDDEGLLF